MNLNRVDLKALYRLLEHYHVPYDDEEAWIAVKKLSKIVDEDGIQLQTEGIKEIMPRLPARPDEE